MRRLVAILIWTVAYFGIAYVKIRGTWGMSIFKIKQWIRLLKEWRSGQWIVDTSNEYTLCIILLLLIPIWLIGMLVVCRIMRPKIPTAPIIQKATESHPFIPAYTPASMPSQGKSAVLSTPDSGVAESTDKPIDEKQMEWVPKDTAEAQALDVITQIAEDAGLTPFPHVLLENELVPITISSDVDAFLIKVLVGEGMWQVGMTEPLEQSLWSLNGRSKNVLKEIILGKGILSRMEPESKVTPVVVLAQGTLENLDTVLPWLNQRGVEVVTLPENPQQGLPQLSEILEKYFPPVPEQEQKDETEQQINDIQKASV